uniref:DarT ssDNA thymidine ADP-ribosyltransferase family protein n=1 Tax=Clostridium sp. TaxID=1506 RepID=UPI0026287B6F
ECVLYEYDEGFELIDWDTMQRVGTTDNYSKHVKMAECLTDLNIPADDFRCIYVKSKETKEMVEDMLNENGININPPYVNVQIWL